MSMRQAARTLANRMSSVGQYQQKRFAGDLPVKPNKYVEELATRRENIEREFQWNRKSLTNLVLFVGVVPYFIYSICVKEFDHSDRIAGRPKRDMWGSSS